MTVSPTGTGSGQVTSNVGGIDCPGTCSATFALNTDVQLSYTLNNSTFAGWGNGCDGSAPSGDCGVIMDADATIKPIFTLNTTYLAVDIGSSNSAGGGTVTSSPSGIDCTSDCGSSFATGSSVTLTATPGAGMEFTSYLWGGVTCAQPMAYADAVGICTVQLTEFTEVSVTFQHDPISFTLTFAGSGSGSVEVDNSPTCEGTCTVQFPYNSPQYISLTASPQTGSTVTWSRANGGSNDCSGTTTPCLFALSDSNASVTVNFNLAPETLTVQQTGDPLGNGTVTSTPGNMDCTSGQCQQTVLYGTTVTLTATADPANSTFTGWSGACSGTGACVVAVTQAEYVEATFVLDQATLTATTSGAGTGTLVTYGSSNPLNCGSQGSTCSIDVNDTQTVHIWAYADSGSAVAGWSPNCTVLSPTECEITISGDVSVNAIFDQTESLSVATSGSGTGTVTSNDNPQTIDCGSAGTACSASYDEGDTVTLTATPDADSLFLGWSGTCTNTIGDCTVPLDQAQSVDADFELAYQPLTVTTQGTGTGTVTSNDNPQTIDCGSQGTSCSASYNYGGTITLAATPDTGQIFEGWSGACTNSTVDCVVTMNQAQSVVATFDANTLTVTTDGTGSVTSNDTPRSIDCGSHGAACSATYDVGGTVTLTATPGVGQSFAGWSGACTNVTGTCTVTMNQPELVTATFNVIDEQLTVSTNGTGHGTVTSGDNPQTINCRSACVADYPYGTVVTLTATPANSLSTFTGWSGACANSKGVCKVALKQVQSVVATFTKVAPVPPKTVSATALAGARVRVTWSSVPNATKYIVSSSTKKAGPYTVVARVTGPPWTSGKLKAGTAYYFVVETVTPNGTSPDSSVASVRTKRPLS